MLCRFSQFSEEDHASLAGGKGRMLAKLYQAGFPVPDGFIILSTAFDENGLIAAAYETVSAFYARLVDASPTGKVAVRSSALAEDSAGASYAGEFETVLEVGTESDLYQAIQTVFESAKSEKVKIYADATDQARIQAMAVVVQHMLAPAYAGVLFTSDPISGNADFMHGNLTEGPGDKLVSGTVTGDAFTYNVDTGVYEGPDYFRPYYRELVSMAARLVHDLGAPQDIEWAVHRDRLFLLQSRPITTLSRTPDVWNDSLKGNYLWCNTNLGELFGNVITPLTWSVFHEIVRRNVGPVGGHFMVGRIAGRSYFNISLIYSILSRIGKKREEILGGFDLFLGQVPDYMDIPVLPISWLDAMGFMLKQTAYALKSALGLRKFLAWAQYECPRWCGEKFLEIEQCKDNADLLRVYAGIEPIVFETFAMVAFVGNQFVQQQYKLKSALSGVLAPESVEVMLSGLDGGGRLPSMAPLLGVAAMIKGEITRDEFIRRYGHRGPNEAEYAAPRTAEDPEWIEKLVRQWQDADPESLLRKQHENRERIWRTLERLPPKQLDKLRKLCESARVLAHNRELAKSENFRQAWVIRRFAIRAAEINGLLPDDLFYLAKDELIRFLRGERNLLEHIVPRRQTFRAYSALPPLPNLISGPIDPFRWSKLPNRRTDCFVAARPAHPVEHGSFLKGFPGSAGLVEGTVRVLTSHEQIEDFVSGEILVTSFTNVGWTPLFPRASAIITDIGAPLSHAAIVARELGIPAVVGTGCATMKLKTGNRVRVDGGRGIVELL
ncbi:pyruvate phosphate dikinase PEP/pyruvate-binding [Methylocaldum marinum]|uniref:Pyruvate phosphate dikinase PEP/pyruvate-binding n=1 Tax=Methylocaldum marinum TaxID=1432792 RepID=A0A250KVV3_9GAMM|nr:PEP/pyruvate-binding domain-containing protein [Methylocaldum marinum]BBA33909.1 pyruvate phosphate dikinase PEP/pyruvate-binding [Methylocaldum marinum]